MTEDMDTNKSRSGYVYSPAGGAISRCSRLQRIVALSTIVCSEFRMPEKAHVLWCDNISAICLAKNAMFHARTKHIDVRYHFIKKLLEDGLVALIKVNTSQDHIDALTKCLPRHNINYVYRWWELLSLKEPPLSFKWDVVGDKASRTLFLCVCWPLLVKALFKSFPTHIFYYIFGPNSGGHRHLHYLYNF